MGKQKRILVFARADMALCTTSDGNGYSFGLGGSGSLTAAGLAKMNLDCLQCAGIGGDYMGKVLKHIYTQLDISQRYLHLRRALKTGLYLRTGSENDRRRAYFPMEQSAPSKDEIEEAFNCLPDAVYLEETFPVRCLDTVFAFANRKKIPVFYRGSGENQIDCKAHQYQIEALIINEKEAAALAGVNTYSISNLAINLSIRVPAKYYLINLGHRGIYLYDGMHRRDLEDPTGAMIHDPDAYMAAFTAGFIAEYLRTENAGVARLIANLCAGLAGKGDGGMDALPTIGEVRAYARKLTKPEEAQ